MNFLLLVPLAVAGASQHGGRHPSPEKSLMVAIILLVCVGPVVVGASAINLLGGLGSGITRLTLVPKGISSFLQAGARACLLVSIASTLLLVAVLFFSHIELSLSQWFLILSESIAGSILFTQLGALTSLYFPRSVDLSSINGWNAYSLAGGLLTLAYMALAFAAGYELSYHHLAQSSWPVAIVVSLSSLFVGGMSFGLQVFYSSISPARQEALLDTLGESAS